MTELEHFEDNLNSNLTNELALTRFIEVAKKVRANLNDKWGDAFIDPGTYWASHFYSNRYIHLLFAASAQYLTLVEEWWYINSDLFKKIYY